MSKSTSKMAPGKDKLTPIDIDVPDNYIEQTLKNVEPLPPITLKTLREEIIWPSFTVLTSMPIIGFIGALTTSLRWQTAVWSFIYYLITGLGITAEYGLAMAGSGAVQGSIKWWSRGHRAHHRYTDTDLDPYNALRGFFYSHIGWMLVRPRRKPGVADVSDLSKSAVVMWQHRYNSPLILFMDARGGFVFAGVCRLVFVHHSTFCVNSLAHWLGETPFDDKHTPKNHMITAFVTVGEGYHNFHHQFPTDYRNAIKWYQYDPTKWFIWCMYKIGLAWQLKTFPSNEIQKGVLTMELKRLKKVQGAISFESFQAQAKKRPLVLISGFIHDVSTFVEEHPGDATTAFFGGVYEHSNAAHNLLAMKRVGILHGGYPHILDIAKTVPPSQRLWVAQHTELSHMWEDAGSTTAWSDEEDVGSRKGGKGLEI
ncbi:delta 9-fatty acid desaturase protein [Hymenopellis radicata]|nr:delta 9-fatty acid desaturase protein [Hymenopellis radicata]